MGILKFLGAVIGLLRLVEGLENAIQRFGGNPRSVSAAR